MSLGSDTACARSMKKQDDFCERRVGMKGSDLIIDIVCSVIVFGMGALALWSEYGGSKPDQEDEEQDYASERNHRA